MMKWWPCCALLFSLGVVRGVVKIPLLAFYGGNTDVRKFSLFIC